MLKINSHQFYEIFKMLSVYICSSIKLFIKTNMNMMWSLLIVGIGCSIPSVMTFAFTTMMDANNDTDLINDRPVIGILAQESYSVQKYFPDHKYKSFIAASYVKYIESGGARVVPIMIGQSNQYYDNMTNSVNGLLFPGGATYFNESGGYGEAGVILYNYAKTKNLPVWGICLGMELIAFAEANSVDHRIDCKALKQALPLLFKSDFKKSKTFGSASDDIISILQNENVTYNYHKYCITEEILKKIGFTSDDWHVLSLNHDYDNNITYVSSFESRKLPIYAIQFHPEKNVFEWIRNKNIPHTENAIKIAQYFLNIFLNATRKNFNRFDEKTEQNALIYNYPVFYTGILGSSYEQLYMFD